VHYHGGDELDAPWFWRHLGWSGSSEAYDGALETDGAGHVTLPICGDELRLHVTWQHLLFHDMLYCSGRSEEVPTVHLKPGPLLRIENVDGAPLPQVPLVAQNPLLALNDLYRSDAAGMILLPLPPSSRGQRALPPGGLIATLRIPGRPEAGLPVVRKGSIPDPTTVVLDGSWSAAVRIQGEPGHPRDANVLLHLRGEAAPLSIETRHGAVTVGGLAPQAEVRIGLDLPPGVSAEDQTITGADGAVVSCVFTIKDERPSFSGHLRFEGGGTGPGGCLRLYTVSEVPGRAQLPRGGYPPETADEVGSADVGPDGRFLLVLREDMAPGRVNAGLLILQPQDYRLGVWYAPLRIEVPHGPHDLGIVALQQDPIVAAGRVVDGRGRGVGDASVGVDLPLDDPPDDWLEPLRANSAPDGQFCIRHALPPGDLVRVTAVDGKRRISVTAPPGSLDLTLPLPLEYRVRLPLVLPSGAQPAWNLTAGDLHLRITLEPFPGDSLRAYGQADEHGLVWKVGRGRYTLRVMSADEVLRASDLDIGDESPEVIELEPLDLTTHYRPWTVRVAPRAANSVWDSDGAVVAFSGEEAIVPLNQMEDGPAIRYTFLLPPGCRPDRLIVVPRMIHDPWTGPAPADEGTVLLERRAQRELVLHLPDESRVPATRLSLALDLAWKDPLSGRTWPLLPITLRPSSSPPPWTLERLPAGHLVIHTTLAGTRVSAPLDVEMRGSPSRRTQAVLPIDVDVWNRIVEYDAIRNRGR
jgi:hypothetical protein